jgi:ABC-type enterochelin transport system ATPase subunit
MSIPNVFERGAEWRKWDLHIHTPASFHWTGQRFNDVDPQGKKALVDQMINAMNAAEPAVFAIMDYWTFDGWFALQDRLQDADAPKLTKTVFPGIELRLQAPMNGRLNAHVLFSDQISKQKLLNFRSQLKVELINQPLSDESLISLVRSHINADKLQNHGFKKAEVDANDQIALKAGSTIAEINCDSYKEAIASVPDGCAIGFMPFDTNDGLAEIKFLDHYAFCLGLFVSSPIFETRNDDTRAAFVGQQTDGNKKWFPNFQNALKNIPRLAVSGSDAHQFKGTPSDNDKRGYGDYPSGKATWIKADPTFLGLLQAIKEPANRSFIGSIPPKLNEVNNNKTFFIDKIEVSKVAGSPIADVWLDGTSIPLSIDLTAIIGNKGSGKSALADIIALLGNSKQKSHFSFLKKERFRGKSGDPAKHFEGSLVWSNGDISARNLNEDPSEDLVELIKYIPQNHFEELCNSHISGKTSAFENELRNVIFDHTNLEIRLGALDFDQLIDQQESNFRDSLNEFRKELKRLNDEIETLEDQSQPIVRKSLEELRELKKKQIAEHMALKPDALAKPDEKLTPEQQAVSQEIESINNSLKALNAADSTVRQDAATISVKQRAIKSIQDRIIILERQFDNFKLDASGEFEVLGLDPDTIIKLQVDSKVFVEYSASLQAQQDKNAEMLLSNFEKITELETSLTSKKQSLNEPQLKYQQNLTDIEQWNIKFTELDGDANKPDSLIGINTRLQQLSLIPNQIKNKEEARNLLVGEIFDALNAQRKAREDLFKPVQDLIQDNSLIREEYKLQFQATLGGSSDILASQLFALIKQNSGEFRGEDESFATLKLLSEQYDLSKKEDVLNFVDELNNKIHVAASGNNPDTVGISSILRKDRLASSVYDLIYSLEYMEPRYSLLFQDTQIEQLSPGQRGALLLIFYLLVDKGRNPIILDQPEENLDNETVVSLLVPVLTEAKKKRQIIMVTHNPNLAVVCDSEQVIYASFDRKNKSKIQYQSGSIENSPINLHVVDVLEGTKRAFDNRKIKYH